MEIGGSKLWCTIILCLEKTFLNIVCPGNPGNKNEHPAEKALLFHHLTCLCSPKSSLGFFSGCIEEKITVVGDE